MSSHREEITALGAAAAAVEENVMQSTTPSAASQSSRTKRHSRLGMHFLSSAMFDKTNAPSASHPPTATSTSTSTCRKSRKTRPIPDMSSTGKGGIPGGMSGPTFSITACSPHCAVDHTATPTIRQYAKRFIEVMNWHVLRQPSRLFQHTVFLNTR